MISYIAAGKLHGQLILRAAIKATIPESDTNPRHEP
jgi:hypothetical protein